MLGVLLALMLVHTPYGGQLGPRPFDPVAGVECPFCGRPTYVTELETFRQDDPLVRIYDDEAHRTHVHSFDWTGHKYTCSRCLWTWTVIEEPAPCPVCGWTRMIGASNPDWEDGP